MPVKVIAIVGESFAQAVTVIKHRGDTIEAEAVKMELFEPILTVGKEEMYHFVFAIVET